MAEDKHVYGEVDNETDLRDVFKQIATGQHLSPRVTTRGR